MSSTVKNILIFGGIGAALVLVYVFFFKSSGPEADLVNSNLPGTSLPGASTSTGGQVSQDFLVTLLSVKNIKLDDALFSTPAFSSLVDSSITLTPDHSQEGRPNPFAPVGIENVPIQNPVETLPASGTTGGTKTGTNMIDCGGNPDCLKQQGKSN